MPLITALPDNTDPMVQDLIVCVHDPLGTPVAMTIKASTLFGFIKARLKQTGRVTANRSTSSTTLAAIPDLDAFTLVANRNYAFRAVIFFTTNALTVGMHFGVGFSGTTTTLRVGHFNPVTAPTAAGSAIAHGGTTAVDTKLLATTAGPGTGGSSALIDGLIEVGASGGTFSFQFASETATSTTVLRGSYAFVEEID